MRLLPKSQLSLRLAPAEEPPAEEANEAPDDNDSSHGDACYGTSGETATLVGIRRYALLRAVIEVEVEVALLALRGLSLGAPLTVRNRALGLRAVDNRVISAHVDRYVVRPALAGCAVGQHGCTN